jgi:hypothetical protein
MGYTKTVKTMIPSEVETCSLEALLKKKGCCGRRTALEKILLSVLSISGLAMTMTEAMVVSSKGENAENQGVKGQMRQEDICVTPECAVAGKDSGLS